jgi:glycogen phosphorylase
MKNTGSMDALNELALNLRWSWKHSTDRLWERLAPELWELTENPWAVLQTVSREKLGAALEDPIYRSQIDELLQEVRDAGQQTRWFHIAHPDSRLKQVAYFSMEYMLSEALPIYSGGLGNVAGDQLKAANDLGVPVVAVGLLYQQGYFRQEFDCSGNQQAVFPYNDPGQLPVQPLRQANGEWVRFPIAMPGLELWIRAWQVKVGHSMLYLLDSNDPENPATYRGITSELYGGGPELRIRQEFILGVGGWRLLRALGLRPEVLHLNEGHAAFAALERARGYMEDHRQPFDIAMAVTRAGNVFTTHTAVDAGFDRFDTGLVEQYLKRYAENDLGISLGQLLDMGRAHAGNSSEPFNMAYLAVRTCGSVNGVSKLHGEVSRRLFQVLFERWPENQVPVGHVTNGVHVPTWESSEADTLWTSVCGKDRWLHALETVEADFRKVTDEQLWQLRTCTTRHLVELARKRLARQRAEQGAPAQEIANAKTIFDPDTLTLGFARRFATYKRPDLLLHDPERLLRILNNSERPVQLILAGKAHPQDGAGQEIVRRWNDFVRRPEARARVVFLSDYDMALTQKLVHGVDLWVNTPRRPWEASGTSGMKVLVNGGLNLSEADGWWPEAYTPEVGWVLGDGLEHGPDHDAAEAETLYEILERDVIPAFYNRDANGIPRAWIAKMRESLARLTPQFSANRTVREYTEMHYLPAAEAYAARLADTGRGGADVYKWQREITEHWADVRFGKVSIGTHQHGYRFEVEVYLGQVSPDSIAVELYANPSSRAPMTRGKQLDKSLFLYSSDVPADRPSSDYTARVIPNKAGTSVPLEASQILWQR